MSDRRDFDSLAPEIAIRVNGSEIPNEVKADLISIVVLDDVNTTGMFSFKLKCEDSAEMEVKWIDDDLVKEGNTVAIDMGYRDNLETLFEGEITALEPEFSSEEASLLTVMGYDRRHRLMGKRKTRSFLNMKDSDIANQVAADWGLTPDIESTEITREHVLQLNQTDFGFLLERARRIGYELIVGNSRLSFRKRATDGDASIVLNREVELLEFSARLSTSTQVGEVSVMGWDPKRKEAIVGESSAGDERPMGGSSGPSVVEEVFAGTSEVFIDNPVQTQADADDYAQGWFNEMALRYVEGQGLCIGRTDLRAGILVDIEGLGQRFSGRYYLTSVKHFYQPNLGYRTAFSARRNAA